MGSQRTPATELARKAGIVHRVHPYVLPERHGRARSERPDYGLEAAEALGVAPDRVFKTLVVSVDDRLVLAVVPADARLDLKALAAVIDGRRADLADPAQAERATGSVVGGIGPLAARRRLPVVVDETAMAHATVLVSAGQRGLQLEVGPSDLITLAGARVAPISRRDGV